MLPLPILEYPFNYHSWLISKRSYLSPSPLTKSKNDISHLLSLRSLSTLAFEVFSALGLATLALSSLPSFALGAGEAARDFFVAFTSAAATSKAASATKGAIGPVSAAASGCEGRCLGAQLLEHHESTSPNRPVEPFGDRMAWTRLEDYSHLPPVFRVQVLLQECTFKHLFMASKAIKAVLPHWSSQSLCESARA